MSGWKSIGLACLMACGTAGERENNGPPRQPASSTTRSTTSSEDENEEEADPRPEPVDGTQREDPSLPEPLVSARVRRLRLIQHGRSLASQGDHAGALEAFRLGLELEGDDPILLCEAGWAAFHVEDPGAADLLLRGSRLQMNPRRRAACLYNRGRLAERDAANVDGAAKDALEAQAAAHYRESLELRPRSSETRRRYRDATGEDFESEGRCPPAGTFTSVQAFCDALAALPEHETIVSCEALVGDRLPDITGEGPAIIIVRLTRSYVEQRDDFLLLPKDGGLVAVAALGTSWYRGCSMGRYTSREISWIPASGQQPTLVIDGEFTRSYSCAPSRWENCAEQADELSECEGLSDETPIENEQQPTRVACMPTDGAYRCTRGIQFTGLPDAMPHDAEASRDTLLPWLRCPAE